jgi:hypothetical protein
VESGLINLPRTRISSIDKLSESEEIDVAISYLERQVTTGRAVDTTIQLETLLNRPGISKSQRDRLIKLKQVVQLRLEHQANKDLQSVHARVQHLLDRNDFLGAEKLIRSAIQSGMRAPELYDCYFRFWDNCAINPLEKLQFLAETASAGTEERRKKNTKRNYS